MVMMLTSARTLACLAVQMLLPFATSLAQSRAAAVPSVAIVRDQVTCATCRISFHSPIVLEPPPDGFPASPQTVARDAAGNIYTGYGFTVELMKHSPAGQLLRHVRPEGDGPGEFRSIQTIAILRGDSIILIDAQLQRGTVADSGGKIARTVRMPTPHGSVVRLRDSILVINSSIRDRRRAGLPLHEFTTTGGIGRSFGDPAPSIRPGHEEDIARVMQRGRGDSLWVVRTSQRYDLELWPLGANAPSRILRREAPWFPARQFPAPTVPSGAAPAPEVLGVWEDLQRRVWVMIRVADPRWKSALARGETVRGHGPARRTYADPAEYYDTLFEVIDADRGVLLAKHREDGLFGPTATPNLVLQMTSARDEEPAFRVLSLTLQAP